MDEILKIKDLKVNIETKAGVVKAVRGIDIELKRGEVLAIVGESGSGKTILCKSIAGILPNNAKKIQGDISLLNKEGKVEKTDKFSMKEISMIFQSPMTSLNPTISIGKQIVEGILNSKKISKKEAKKEAIEIMEAVGIDFPIERFNSMPHEFSGGMRQRIVIAIALCLKPKILIADEPTTALDVTMQKVILNLIIELQRKMNLSIIFVTHDLSVVANIADRVAVMYAGKIIELGTVEDIFYDPRHPYTKALLKSLPTDNSERRLFSIEGMPPSLINLSKGDSFARRNKEALRIDFKEEPPMFEISETHKAATWLLHPLAQELNKEMGVI